MASTVRKLQAQKMFPSVKSLVASPALTSIPSAYTYTRQPHEDVSDSEDPVPVLDFSLLTSGDPDQRARAIDDLGKACRDWGFFMVVNHGMPENMMKEVIDACQRFFDLTEEEKREYEGKSALDPIKYGTSFNTSVDKALCWRDYLKLVLHPVFSAPANPPSFREILLEYSRRLWKIQLEVLKAVSESLGLGSQYINEALDMNDNGSQMVAINFYPPCPDPDSTVGLPPHSDLGLLTFLLHNGVDGLEVQHRGRWVRVRNVPNCFLVNLCDHLEIFSNGVYKSVVHRATVNNSTTRISLATVVAPALDAVVSPAPELMELYDQPPAYRGIKFKEYFLLQQKQTLHRKSCLERLRI